MLKPGPARDRSVICFKESHHVSTFGFDVTCLIFCILHLFFSSHSLRHCHCRSLRRVVLFFCFIRHLLTVSSKIIHDGNSQLFRDFFHISNHLSVVYETLSCSMPYTAGKQWWCSRAPLKEQWVLNFETKLVFKSSEMSWGWLLLSFRWSHGRSICKTCCYVSICLSQRWELRT